MDELDRQILRILHRDGRMPYSVMARDLDSNEATIRKRVQRLINDDIVQIVGVSNPYHLGLNTHVLIGIEVELPRLEQIAELLGNFEELNYVAVSSGLYDIVVVGVFASDVELYQFLTHKLAAVDGIRSTHTAHLLRLMRRTFSYPIPPDCRENGEREAPESRSAQPAN